MVLYLADSSTVESSPVCRTPIIEDCSKDENLSSLESTSYSVPHTAEVSHAKVSLWERWLDGSPDGMLHLSWCCTLISHSAATDAS
ncbi:hypothetical protein KOW79_001450 [Hemibagrus wyckioides]|uniref:Uncharacterized protein n=1 Tax=Hemibagrus wyckioides TaxID=337641 RepID=A0A9D3P6D1_9TELE|nr:hypothetical protein KOW79_001450 [Hemibagrus wyckioides]